MISQRCEYANPHKLACAAAGHLRWWNGTFCKPIKG